MEPEYQIKHKASTNYNQKESTDAEARTHDPASNIFNKNSSVEIEHQSLPIRNVDWYPIAGWLCLMQMYDHITACRPCKIMTKGNSLSRLPSIDI